MPVQGSLSARTALDFVTHDAKIVTPSKRQQACESPGDLVLQVKRAAATCHRRRMT
jgi:hypothetical protein